MDAPFIRTDRNESVCLMRLLVFLYSTSGPQVLGHFEIFDVLTCFFGTETIESRLHAAVLVAALHTTFFFFF